MFFSPILLYALYLFYRYFFRVYNPVLQKWQEKIPPKGTVIPIYDRFACFASLASFARNSNMVFSGWLMALYINLDWST